MRRLITTDSHLVPPVWLTDELPEKWRAYFPRLETIDGVRHIVYPSLPGSEGQMMITSGGRGRVVPVETDEELARVNHSNVCDDARPAFDPDRRLEEMARDGVVGAVLIDNATVSYTYVQPEAETAWCRIVNDWMAQTYSSHLDQFAPGIHLPLQDVGAAVKELERAAGMGLRPAVLPDALGDRPYHLTEWEPLWEAGAQLGVPFTMHIGGTRFHSRQFAGTLPGTGSTACSLMGAGASALLSWYTLNTSMAETIGWFVFSGLLQKYPELTIVMTEGFAGWLAFAMQFFDHQWTGRWGAHVREKWSLPGQGPVQLDALPSYYMKRQAKVTFMWDPVAEENRNVTGTDCLLWGNDYPHVEGSFPDSQNWVDKQFSGVPETEIDAMVRLNAASIFGLTP
jgi:predicted TIM-barrel fold metal-dependent hydrolase